MTVTSVSCAGLCEGASLRLRPISRLGVPCCSSGRSQRCAGSGGRAGHRRPAIRAVLVVLEHVVAEVDAGLGLVGEPVTLGTEDEKGRAGTLTHEERRAMAGRYGDRSAPPGVVHALEGAPSMGRPRLPGRPTGRHQFRGASGRGLCYGRSRRRPASRKPRPILPPGSSG